MSKIVEILIFFAFISVLILGINALAATPIISTQLAHIKTFFDFIIGNLKNISQFFPIYDLVAIFSAFLLIESIILAIKISNYFIKIFKK